MSFGALLSKDLSRELRGRDALTTGGVLVATMLLAAMFVITAVRGDVAAAALVLWFPLLYGGLAAAGRGLANEADAGTLDYLQSLPVPMAWHGISRTLANALVTLVLGGATLLLLRLLFGLELSLEVIVIVIISAFGIALLGTLVGGLAAGARSREILLPVLAIPLLAPLLQAGTKATLSALQGATFADLQSALLLMIGYLLVMAGVAWLVWGIVLEAE